MMKPWTLGANVTVPTIMTLLPADSIVGMVLRIPTLAVKHTALPRPLVTPRSISVERQTTDRLDVVSTPPASTCFTEIAHPSPLPLPPSPPQEDPTRPMWSAERAKEERAEKQSAGRKRARACVRARAREQRATKGPWREPTVTARSFLPCCLTWLEVSVHDGVEVTVLHAGNHLRGGGAGNGDATRVAPQSRYRRVPGVKAPRIPRRQVDTIVPASPLQWEPQRNLSAQDPVGSPLCLAI